MNNLSEKAYKAFKEAFSFKEDRIKEGSKNVDLYNLKIGDEQIGFLNFPTTDMHSFVEDWCARMPNLSLRYKALKSLANKEAENKMNALIDRDSLVQFADYEGGNRACNKYACLYGVGIAKIWSESINGYKHHFDVIDPVDFFCQPYGGANLETHKLCGETGIFKTRYELEEGMKKGIYTKEVKDLLDKTGDSKYYQNQNRNDWEDKQKRFSIVGKQTESAVFEDLYHFAEVYYEYRGERYYELIDVQTGLSIRQEKLTDLFKSGLYPYTAWQPKYDVHNFWSISPADIKRPEALQQQEVQNYLINNMRQLVKPLRAYKPEAFDRVPKYIPNGWLAIRTGSPISVNEAVARLDVVDLTNPLMKYAEMIAYKSGIDTGITAGMQGQSESDKVGINERNIQQATRKILYSNESHTNFAIGTGIRHLWGAREHLGNKESVKIMGALGLETVKVLKADAEVDFDIEVEDMQKKSQEDSIKAQNISMALNSQIVMQFGNPKKVMEILLKNAGITDSDIGEIMDVDKYGEARYVEKAENAFQMFIEGKTPDTYINANNIFMQRFLDLMTQNADEIKPEVMAKMQMYLDKTHEIAMFNAESKATNEANKDNIAQMKAMPPPEQPQPTMTEQPMMEQPINQPVNV